MRTSMHIEETSAGHVAVLVINGVEVKLSNKEFDALFADMRWAAREIAK